MVCFVLGYFVFDLREEGHGVATTLTIGLRFSRLLRSSGFDKLLLNVLHGGPTFGEGLCTRGWKRNTAVLHTEKAYD
jgi:hypothetical protein